MFFHEISSIVVNVDSLIELVDDERVCHEFLKENKFEYRSNVRIRDKNSE